MQAADGWIALNLARDTDWDLLPAWLELEFESIAWQVIERRIAGATLAELVAGATLLGLPVSAVGEVARERLKATVLLQPVRAYARRLSPPRVVDLSALWAGPLCGAILAAMGASVLRVESQGRPDPTKVSTPDFFRRLNAGKAELTLDLAKTIDLARLTDEILSADILITSARPRAFDALGLSPDVVFEQNPNLIWVAITGYGWCGPNAARVAFGDDAAAAGGLLHRDANGVPCFLGDALADPITGLMAATGALEVLAGAPGGMIDAALAGCAAGAATALQT